MREARKTKSKRRIAALVIWLVLAALVAGLITYFSGESASESNQTSKGVLRTLLEFFLGEDNEALVDAFNHFIRKSAHFTLFAAFGLCFCAAMQYQDRLPRLPVSLGAGALLAVEDEVRQHFVPGRATQVKDMLIDFCGVLVGALIVTLVAYLVRKRRTKKLEKTS